MSPERRTAGSFNFLIPICLTALALASCDSPLHGTLRAIVGDYNMSSVQVSPDLGALGRGTKITVTFTKTMDPGSLALGGSLGDTAQATWSRDLPAGRPLCSELVLSPRGTWPEGVQTLSLACVDSEGFPAEELSLVCAVLGGAVYVSATGSDDNPGSADLPFRSLNAAQGMLLTLNAVTPDEALSSIHLAEGRYDTHEFELAEEVRLEGGWKTDWSVQDPELHESIVAAVAEAADYPRYGIRIAGTKPAIRLRSISLEASDIANWAFTGIDLGESSATIEKVTVRLARLGSATSINNSITGIAQTKGSSRILDCQVLIDDCAPNDSTTFTGISLSGECADSPTLSGCTVRASDLGRFTALEIQSCQALVEGNTLRVEGILGLVTGIRTDCTSPIIRNNVVDVSTDTLHESWAVYSTFGSPTVQNNTLVYTKIGVLAAMRAHPVVENNLFLRRTTSPALSWASAYCEWTSDSAPERFSGNHAALVDADELGSPAFIFVYVDLQLGESGTGWNESDLGDLESTLAGSNIPSSGNNAVCADESGYFNPQTWDFLVPASVPSSITEGALDLSTEFTVDHDGRARPAGRWSIGAWQKP